MISLPTLAVLLVVPAFLAYLLTAGHFEQKVLPYKEGTIDYAAAYKESAFVFEEVRIPVPGAADNAVLHGWLLTPKGKGAGAKEDTEGEAGAEEALPLVLLAHGLGGQKDMGLLPYAEKFCGVGYAALMIDYRYFGGSTHDMGEGAAPRNWINPWNHVADISTAVTAIKQGILGPRIDPQKLLLWGTSFAGGHMLTVAGAFPKNTFTGVISQVPHLDGKAASKKALKTRGVLGFIRLMLIALGDLASGALGLPPLYVKIVGTAEETAYMLLGGADKDAYFKKHPSNYLGGWQNLAPARTTLLLSLYSPQTAVPHLDLPILFVAAKRDDLCPPEIVAAAASTAAHPLSLHLQIDSTHFELYQGAHFQHVTHEMTQFAARVGGIDAEPVGACGLVEC